MLALRLSNWKVRTRLVVTLFLAIATTILSPAMARANPVVTVGYYDMAVQAGNETQRPAITVAGHTPLFLADLTAADLEGVDVLFIQNPDNGSYGHEYLSRLSNIADAVADGMVLIIHDRYVDAAETILPGGDEFNIVRDFSDDANIDVVNNTTLVTNGPGGVIDDTTLDGGTFSSHGFTIAGSLPDDATLILSRTNTSEIVTFRYFYGAGSVIFSSIPLDYYLEGDGPEDVGDNFRNIYAPNVVAYGASLSRLTPEEQIAEMRMKVAELVDDGVLNKGQGNALTTKLDGAMAKLDRNNKKAAANQLKAFVNQVEAFQKSKRLTRTQAQPLLDTARNVIEQLRQ